MKVKPKYILLIILGFMFLTANAQHEEVVHALPAADEVICWKGILGKGIPILIQYQMSDELLIGSITYLNTSEKHPITLLGTINEYNQFHLKEFDSSGNTTGHIHAQIIGDELKGSWNTFYGTRTYPVSLSRIDTLIHASNIDASAEDIYGSYHYQFDEDGGSGSLTVEKAENGAVQFEIHTILGAKRGYNMADVEKEKAHLVGNSFTYRLPEKEDSEFRVRLFKDFAYVDYISGNGYGYFGMNADVHGFYIKNTIQPEYLNSHEKILKKMEYAVKKLSSDSNVFMNYHDIYFNDLDELTSQAVDTLFLTDKFVECFGKPVNEDFTRYQDDDSDWVTEWGELDFPYFSISTFDQYTVADDNGYGEMIGIKTATPGFGFGGVYVGIPECNKEYLIKLFSKLDPDDIRYENHSDEGELYDNSMFISLIHDFQVVELRVFFDENDVVKEVGYRLSGII